MTCPDANTWNLLSMNLLDETCAESLREHCLECERCQAAWEEVLRQHTNLLDAFEAFDGNHDQRREQLMAMLPHSVSVPAKDSDIVLGAQWLGGIAMSMRRHKTRWAAVALLPAACLLFALVLMTGEKTAFADILQKIRMAKSMTCDMVTTTTVGEGALPDPMLKEPSRGTVSMYLDGDTRAVLIDYDHLGTKSRSLYLGDMAYVWVGGAVRAIRLSGAASQHQAPGDLLSQLLQVRESPDRSLGEETIAGRRAVGFEIAGWKLGYGTRPAKGKPASADSDVRLRVWVDVEQDLPVRMEIEQPMVMPDVTAVVCNRWDNIKWNVPLDADDFRAPAEEEIAKAETIQVPTADEATFINGLRAWLESKDKARAGIDVMKKKAEEKGEELPAPMSGLIERAAMDAGYPERLDSSWLSSTFSARASLDMFGEMFSDMKPIPTDLDKEERNRLVQSRAKESAMAGAEVAMKAGMKAMAVAVFHQKLANEQRDPEYFGATVKPGDKEAVLLRWKLDDGRHRVIYGDLRVETVD